MMHVLFLVLVNAAKRMNPSEIVATKKEQDIKESANNDNLDSRSEEEDGAVEDNNSNADEEGIIRYNLFKTVGIWNCECAPGIWL